MRFLLLLGLLLNAGWFAPPAHAEPSAPNRSFQLAQATETAEPTQPERPQVEAEAVGLACDGLDILEEADPHAEIERECRERVIDMERKDQAKAEKKRKDLEDARAAEEAEKKLEEKQPDEEVKEGEDKDAEDPEKEEDDQ